MRAVAIVLLAAVLAAPGCGGDAPAPEPALSGAVEVSAESARIGLLRQVVTANGQITPHPDADWTIHAAETAIVAELPVQEGEPVEVNDLVARFEVASRTSAIQTAEFEITQWTTRLERAKVRVAELTTLYQGGLTARVDLDAAKAEVATAETTLATATATLAGLRAAEARDVVRARFPGIVLTRWHYQGDLVVATGSDPVLRIVDPSRTQVALDVPVADAGKLVAGQRATVTPAGSFPIVTVVAAVMPAASADATTTRVIVALPTPPTSPTAPTPPTPPTLSIGDTVWAEILIAEVPEALVVPTPAILRAGGTPYVLVIGPDGRALRRDLRVGLATPELTQVLDGLEIGEVVITSGLTEISEGDPVRRRI